MHKFTRFLLRLLAAFAVCFFVWSAYWMDIWSAPAKQVWFVPCILSVLSLPAWFLLAFLREKRLIQAFAVLVAGALVISLIDWHPRHRFINTLRSVQPGDSKEEALAIMAPYLDKSPWLNAPREVVYDEYSVLSFRWNDSSPHFNADIGVIYLQNGLVDRVDFHPD